MGLGQMLGWWNDVGQGERGSPSAYGAPLNHGAKHTPDPSFHSIG